MSIDRKLLEILVCPVTKQPISILGDHKLAVLNERIAKGEVENHGGQTLTEPLVSALITQNGTVIYPVESNIPVMLENESIATLQLGDW